jgi:hypothetical protein
MSDNFRKTAERQNPRQDNPKPHFFRLPQHIHFSIPHQPRGLRTPYESPQHILRTPIGDVPNPILDLTNSTSAYSYIRVG